MTSPVAGHYTSGRLETALLEALRAAGHDPDRLQPDDLATVEEFHVLGRAATTTLADAAKVTAGDRVLDVGCGIGGPARFLHRTYGCRVTGIDLTAEFCEVARNLNARCGLTDGIEIRQADALDLPFADASFDVVWTQHVAMNIADKAALYRELHRVLRPGGRLAFFDIVAGPVQPIHFPVPWAEDPSISFLEPAEAVRSLVEAAGFSVELWVDTTAEAREFMTRLTAGPPPVVGLHLLQPDFPTKAANASRNLNEDRIRTQRCVAIA